ncbi:MAG: DNA repair protein RecO [Anaerolineales bacterium]|nr:DNA repair protein RecO [Anaerolineales bacterium]
MPREARSQRVEAIILKHSDFGEADRLLTLYTREQGKLRALAKGARKPGSRKGGHLEPFSRSRLQLASGRDLYIVSQAEAIETHGALSADLEALGYASYAAELADKFSAEGEAQPGLYRLLAETLARLASGENQQLAVRFYEVRLLDQVGFRPELQNCLDCGEQIQPQDQFFSFEQGGALCPRCGRAQSGARPISLPALKWLRHLQRSSYTQAGRADPAPSTQRELESLMNAYLTYLAERGLNTPRFLERVRRSAAQ